MGPYSHYILASRLLEHLHPDNPAEYLWGAVAPDIRYLARMRREKTHLPPARLRELSARFPHLQPFLLGYRVHCLVDMVDVARLPDAAFPFGFASRLMRGRLSRQQMTMLVEMYFLQGPPFPGVLSGRHNEILEDMGISAEMSRTFSAALQEYFDAHSAAGALSAFQKIGMVEDSRVEKYMRAYQAMHRHHLLRAALMAGLSSSHFDRRIVEWVRREMGRSGNQGIKD